MRPIGSSRKKEAKDSGYKTTKKRPKPLISCVFCSCSLIIILVTGKAPELVQFIHGWSKPRQVLFQILGNLALPIGGQGQEWPPVFQFSTPAPVIAVDVRIEREIMIIQAHAKVLECLELDAHGAVPDAA